MQDPDQVAAYERRFRRAGLPLFIEGYSASSDVFNRAVPLLGLVFIGQMLGAVKLDWPVAANIAAVGGALAILLLSIGLVNCARGRPFRSIPEDIGRLELAGFVLLPALLPLIFGGQWLSALVTAGGNLLLLALVYGVVGYGLLSIVRWVFARLLSQLASSLGLLTKAVPLLMLFSLLLFLTQEIWQVFSEVPRVTVGILAGLFLLLGTVFLMARLPREVRGLELEMGASGPPLDRRQRVNVGLVLFVSQAIQVLVVSIVVGLFFIALGLLIVDADVLRNWIGSGGNVLVTLPAPGQRAILTEELLRVSGAIASFTGLYFAISMLTDDLYRREFLEELTGEMRESFRARAKYLKARRA